ncbi:MAG: DNA polymerase III subunit epsilon, partial [Pseudomonadota bacterium]|nr:DNA polymerase III subunit epsilon [Pseudomonadota bacterium]
AILTDMFSGGVNLPWNLAVAAAIALSLLFTRLTFGADPSMANWDHLIGSLALTIISLAAAEVARAVRFFLIPLGIALCVTPFLEDASTMHLIANMLCGGALILLSIRRGGVKCRYGTWDRFIV